MRTTLRPKCVRRAPSELTVWARELIADPARYSATLAEAAIVASLLAELEVSR